MLGDVKRLYNESSVEYMRDSLHNTLRECRPLIPSTFDRTKGALLLNAPPPPQVVSSSGK